jgi:RHS repeat-associated protein
MLVNFRYDALSSLLPPCVLDLPQFTGKERDAESGLDYFGARYYGSNMGRFMSPDWAAKAMPVPYAKMNDPQSLNLYNYMLNNPLGGVDADGHDGCGYICSSIIGYVSVYIARHPRLEEASHHITDGPSVTVRAGGGVTSNAIPGVKGEATITGYVKASGKGVGAGVDIKTAGTSGGAGIENTTNVPLVKDSSFVNPLTNSTNSNAGTIGATHSDGTVAGSASSDEVSLGGTYGEGPVVGAEVGSTGAANFLREVGNSIVDDVKDTVNQIKQGIDNLKHPN